MRHCVHLIHTTVQSNCLCWIIDLKWKFVISIVSAENRIFGDQFRGIYLSWDVEKNQVRSQDVRHHFWWILRGSKNIFLSEINCEKWRIVGKIRWSTLGGSILEIILSIKTWKKSGLWRRSRIISLPSLKSFREYLLNQKKKKKKSWKSLN